VWTRLAPKLDSAVGVTSEGAFRLFRIHDGLITEMAIDGLASAGSRYIVAFSPSASSVALYSDNRVQLLRGLPDAPVLGGSIDLSAAGVPSALAVSDDARTLLVSVNNSIRFFESYADMGKLIDTAPGALVAFAAGGLDAAVADSGAGVVLFHDLAGGGASQVIAPPDANQVAFSALAFSSDGKSLFLASAAGCEPSCIFRAGFLFGWQISLPGKRRRANRHAVGSFGRLAHSHSVQLFPDGTAPHG
jgi:hypothetical protein